MKIKIQESHASRIFEFLDKNQDGYLSYTEFCGLCEDPSKPLDFSQLHESSVEAKEELDKLSQLSRGQFYKGLKSNKISKIIP